MREWLSLSSALSILSKYSHSMLSPILSLDDLSLSILSLSILSLDTLSLDTLSLSTLSLDTLSLCRYSLSLSRYSLSILSLARFLDTLFSILRRPQPQPQLCHKFQQLLDVQLNELREKGLKRRAVFFCSFRVRGGRRERACRWTSHARVGRFDLCLHELRPVTENGHKALRFAQEPALSTKLRASVLSRCARTRG